MAKPPKDIDAYIAAFPKDVQERLQQVRMTIRKAAPKAVEAIKYAIPAFVLNGKNLIYFAGYKEHIGVYPVPREAAELAEYQTGKGTLRFPLDRPTPLRVITRVVKLRMREIAGN